MRNEELGINAVAPLGRVLFYAPMPRAVPTADGVCPFQGAGWVRCVESGNERYSDCWRNGNAYARFGRIANRASRIECLS